MESVMQLKVSNVSHAGHFRYFPAMMATCHICDDPPGTHRTAWRHT